FNIPSSDPGCSAPGVGTIALNQTLPVITNAAGLTIDGSGQSITISGGDAVRVLNVAIGAVATIKRLAITHGKSPHCGPILNNVFTGSGGGICNLGTLTVIESSFSNNVGLEGGAILSIGPLTVSGSTFSDNTAINGSAIYAAVLGTLSAPFTLTNSTVS